MFLLGETGGRDSARSLTQGGQRQARAAQAAFASAMRSYPNKSKSGAYTASIAVLARGVSSSAHSPSSAEAFSRFSDRWTLGRREIVEFLQRKWEKELDYRLKKTLWAFDENRIAVRFEYEWHDESGQWFRSHGNENWEFDENGLMAVRRASINDMPIAEEDRLFRWPLGPRPEGHPGLSDLGL